MVNTSVLTPSQRWNSLSCQQGNASDLAVRCLICGSIHSTEDHWQFMADMPADPANLIDDLVKMRLYQPAAIAVADAISQAELRTSLFVQMAGQGNPKREKLVLDLIKLAGGLGRSVCRRLWAKGGAVFYRCPADEPVHAPEVFAKYCRGGGAGHVDELRSAARGRSTDRSWSSSADDDRRPGKKAT